MSHPKLKLVLIPKETKVQEELTKHQEHLQKRRDYYQANKERLLKAQREYYQANKPVSNEPKIKKTENKQEYQRQYRMKIVEDANKFRTLMSQGLVPDELI